MYQGFEDENLSDPAAIEKAFEHLGRLYWATAHARRDKDPGLAEPGPQCHHPGILHEVLVRMQKDLKHNAPHPNEFKQSAYLTFWIRKLKPFRHYPIFGGTMTNEFLGLHFGLATLSVAHPHVLNKVASNQRLWDEWLYDLRYRPISGHELAKQFEMLSMP